jgi:hypothetical protein
MLHHAIMHTAKSHFRPLLMITIIESSVMDTARITETIRDRLILFHDLHDLNPNCLFRISVGNSFNERVIGHLHLF